MNGPMRKRLYKMVAVRDGEYCRGCSKLPSEGQLVVDHRDNESSNNNPSNLQLLCRRCNFLKNPRKEPVDLSVSESIHDGTVTEIDISRRKEPLFRKFAIHAVNEHDEVPQNDIINAGAEEIDISPAMAESARAVSAGTESSGVAGPPSAAIAVLAADGLKASETCRRMLASCGKRATAGRNPPAVST